MKETRGEKIFYAFNYFVLTIAGILTFTPFLNVIAKSLSSESAVISGQVKLIPIGLQFSTYKLVLSNTQFLNSFKVSVFITVVGTILCMLMTVVTAYPLSRTQLIGRKYFLLAYVFIMLFNGGMIPNYLLIKTLMLYNTVWALILPSLINVFNLLLMKNFLEGMPESLEESARIDGANNLWVLISIIIPVSLPAIATISLFYAVAYWNSFFNAVLYISNPKLRPLQQYLKEMLELSKQSAEKVTSIDDNMNRSPEAIQAATIIASTLPILIVYPFLQKYFVKGLVVGSVKG